MAISVENQDDVTTEVPGSRQGRAFDLLTAWHGAPLVFDERDGQLYHVHPSRRLDVQHRVRLYRFAAQSNLALLIMSITVDQRITPTAILVQVEEMDQECIRIVRPSDSFRLSVVIGTEEHEAGEVGFHVATGSIRERLHLQADKTAGLPLPRIVKLLQDIQDTRGSLQSIDGLIAVTESIPSILLELLASISSETLCHMVPALRASTVWPQLFPKLQCRMSEGQPVFSRSTRELMRDRIAGWGWKIGEHSYGEPIVLDGDQSSLTIGRFCSIAGNVIVVLGNHTTHTATSFPFVSLRRQWPSAAAAPDLQDHVARPVTIGNDVWIGVGAVILPGTNIGHGSVVGANAVVRGDIAPYSIMAGNPARCVRKRFEDDVIARLLSICWWDWSDDRIDRFIPFLLDPDISHFLEVAESESI